MPSTVKSCSSTVDVDVIASVGGESDVSLLDLLLSPTRLICAASRWAALLPSLMSNAIWCCVFPGCSRLGRGTVEDKSGK